MRHALRLYLGPLVPLGSTLCVLCTPIFPWGPLSVRIACINSVVFLPPVPSRPSLPSAAPSLPSISRCFCFSLSAPAGPRTPGVPAPKRWIAPCLAYLHLISLAAQDVGTFMPAANEFSHASPFARIMVPPAPRATKEMTQPHPLSLHFISLC